MQVQSKQKQSVYLINALKYCHCSNPISTNLIIQLSEKLQVCPQLLAQQLIFKIEHLPCKNPDPKKSIESINWALSQSLPISNKLKERIAQKIGVNAMKIN